MERSVILSTTDWLTIEPHVLLGTLNASTNQSGFDRQVSSQLTTETNKKADSISADEESLESIEKSHILSVLGKANWRIEGEAGAAQILGLHPNTLRSRMKKLGISRPTS